ncbi:colicin import membrane protein [Actinobacillus pleuropneumoniae serovar 3 str. JL03]|uniref:Colicin import membrane protein n=1 Tax=Actinobacillus pleuropneumoniae serotype 3 (strain JL03) TaxID=434271 RepID=B0BSD5_ACTPJ|nr:Slam-dependent surface lipoprotein [Actinobacillus pleuropneumoniae]ABY70292.1 colicin import membrane protein [Actinobacillus pleuropneumoniae serovar 3 str. JL03]UKH44388.1 colicin transporter [Actinobacillus pleuropneumoniae]
MSIKRISIATAILLSLTACGSSSDSNNVTKPTPQAEQTTQVNNVQSEAEAKAKAEAEAKAKAEAEAKAKAEAEAKAKAEAEAKAKAEAEAKAKAEAEAKAKAEAEAKAKAEAEAKAKAEAEAKAKAEAEAKAKAEAEAKAKAEAEAKAKAEAEAKAKAEAEAKEKAEAEAARIAQKMKDLISVAKEKGLSDNEAQLFAQDNINNDDSTAQKNLDNKVKTNELISLAQKEGLSTYNAQLFATDNINSTDDEVQSNLEDALIKQEKGGIDKPYGLTKEQYGTSSSSSLSCTNGRCYNVDQSITSGEVIYNQKYSIITADTVEGTRNNLAVNELNNVKIKGLTTKAEAIPTEGSATYSGEAFDATYKGKLSYNVNFADKTGSGSITGLGNDITLEQGSIKGTGISATATQSYKSGEYSLGFYGKNAEEVSGKVSFDGKDVVGFGGTRGEIKK